MTEITKEYLDEAVAQIKAAAQQAEERTDAAAERAERAADRAEGNAARRQIQSRAAAEQKCETCGWRGSPTPGGICPNNNCPTRQ